MALEHFNLNGDTIVTILGGSGFVGKHITKHIAKTGARIKVVSRDASTAKELNVCGSVGQIALINSNLNNVNNLEKVIKGSTIVINLLGILHENRKQKFDDIHVKAAYNASKIAANNHVKKFIHFSALGVDKALKSNYAKTKLIGERAILQNFPQAIIFRPSVIFGNEDNFINFFEKISSCSPFIPLIGKGKTKLQPVYVENVAQATLKAIIDDNQEFLGKVLELAGPKVYTLKEIFRLILKYTKRKRILLNTPFFAAKIIAFFLEQLPNSPLSRDQVTLLQYDNVQTGINGLKLFNIDATSLETMLPIYFS